MSETTKEIIKSNRLGCEYSIVKHKSGLTVYLWKMEDYSTTEAAFVTKYGSINNRFKTSQTGDFITVPEGIAHYLEHKLFENEDSDVFELYAKTGANANAFTSFDSTCYVFSCSENYEKNLEILLDFVQKPYFTEESVAKEQGIIGQEIKMCQDSPERACFFNLLKAMFVNHPVKIDIAGTVESIAEITPQLLYQCYETFYNLNNMALVVAGNFDEKNVMEIVDKMCSEKKNAYLETTFPEEPVNVACKKITAEFPVGLPIFNFGFKSSPVKGREYVKKSLIATILMQLIAGQSSDLYQKLFDMGLINSQFNVSIFCGEGYFSCIFAGESHDTDFVCKSICNEIERIKTEGIDREEFEIQKKAMYGSFVRATGDAEVCADSLTNSFVAGVDVFAQPEILAELTPEDCQNALADIFNPEYSSVSIVYNKDNTERNED